MSYETLSVETEGPLAVVTIRREPQLNALSSRVIAELTQVVGELDKGPAVRVVALTGAGDKAFVAGADIAEMKDLTAYQARTFAEHGGVLGTAIERSVKIWVAAV